MSHTELRAPSTSVAYPGRVGKTSPPIGAISVGLSEPAASAVAWRIRIMAVFSGGVARLGEIRTAPLSGKRRAARVVGIASCPGALQYRLFVAPIRPYSASDARGLLTIDGIREPTEAGILPLDGSVLMTGGPFAGPYNHAAGTVPGSVALPSGSILRGYSVLATAGGPVTVTLTSPIFGALPVITVPSSGGFEDTPENFVGPGTIAFGGNTAAWWVSWREVG